MRCRVLMLFCVVLIAVPIAGQEKKDADKQLLTGQVAELQADRSYFVLRTADEQELKLHMNADTRLQFNNKDLKLADLKNGMVVSVVYVRKDGMNLATRIATSQGSVPLGKQPDRQGAAAANTGQDAKTPEPPDNKAITVTGKVAKIESDLNRLTIRPDGDKAKDVTVIVPERLKFSFRNDKLQRLGDLSEGTLVKVIYVVEEDGRKVATSITDPTKEIVEAPSTPREDPARPGTGAAREQPRGAERFSGRIIQVKGDLTIVSMLGTPIRGGEAGVGAAAVRTRERQVPPAAEQRPATAPPINPGAAGERVGVAQGVGVGVVEGQAANLAVLTTANSSSNELLHITAETRLLIDATPARANQLRPGMDLTVSATARGGKWIVTQIDAVSAAAVTPAPQP